MFQVPNLFPLFVDLGGNLLTNGYIYIGAENQNPETNPIVVYWDKAGLIPADQPLRTINGQITRNGISADIYVGAAYSITVRDVNSRLVSSKLSVTDTLTSGDSSLDWGEIGISATYASASSFTVASATNFHVGRRIKLAGGADRYGYVSDVTGLTVAVDNITDSSGVTQTLHASMTTAYIGAATNPTTAINSPIYVASKAIAVKLTPRAGMTLWVGGTDGGLFYAVTGAAPGTYADNGGSYCGTVYIPTGGDGSSAWLSHRVTGVIQSRKFGIIGADLQRAIDAAVIDGGGIVQMPIGTIDLSTTSITLYEGVTLIGAGRTFDGNVNTWLTYSGTGNGIVIDGEWSASTYRRYIGLRDFGIHASAGANAGIYSDFATVFNMERLAIYGAATYGIDFINSYNGTMREVRTQGHTNGIRFGVKASPDDVFSGQIIMDNVEVWSHTGTGLEINSSVNLLSQFPIRRLHTQACGTGLLITGANVSCVSVETSQFEDSTTNDINIASSVIEGPIVNNCLINSVTPSVNFQIDGDNCTITDNKFIQTKTGGKCIVDNGAGNVTKRNRIRQTSGNTIAAGIELTGSHGRSSDNRFIGGTSAAMACIVNSGDSNVIGKQVFAATVASGRCADTGTNTTFEDSVNLVTDAFDLSGSAAKHIFGSFNRAMYIRKVRIIYTEGSSADAGVVIGLGRKVSGGSESLTQYINSLSEVSKSEYDETTETLVNIYLAPTDKLVAYSAGGKVGTGAIKMHIELIPWNYL